MISPIYPPKTRRQSTDVFVRLNLLVALAASVYSGWLVFNWPDGFGGGEALVILIHNLLVVSWLIFVLLCLNIGPVAPASAQWLPVQLRDNLKLYKTGVSVGVMSFLSYHCQLMRGYNQIKADYIKTYIGFSLILLLLGATAIYSAHKLYQRQAEYERRL